MLKISFFNNEDSLLDLKTYLRSTKLTPYSYHMLYARLLYPSYYFDMYDSILQGKVQEEKLHYYLSKVDTYEEFLKNLFFLINQYYRLPPIEWLIKT